MTFSNTTLSASEWEVQIRKVVPANIELTEVERKSTHLRVVGKAKENADVTRLMRAIDRADLGSPQLENIQRKDDMSSFVLNIMPTH